MEKLNGLSMDIEQTERKKLRSAFPECFPEGKLYIDNDRFNLSLIKRGQVQQIINKKVIFSNVLYYNFFE